MTAVSGKFYFVFLLFLCTQASAQQDSTLRTFNGKRLAIVAGTEATLYAGSITALSQLWYSDYSTSQFHSFDDSREWLQMDKVGHATTAYYIGRVGIGLLDWSGVKRKKAIWYGGMLGFVYQGTIEVMDGYSGGWGFSWSDMTANTAGTILCIGQELAWNDQRITLKYSFMQSPFAKYRPSELGTNILQNMLKDYNGQTYWLSVNPSAFMSHDTRFPKWLNIAMGYGASGMTGGDYNPPFIDADGTQVSFERYRQYYLSLDVDLTRLHPASKFLKTVFNTIGFIKIPAPALEFSRNGIKGSLLGF